jgi:hypothetical protein
VNSSFPRRFAAMVRRTACQPCAEESAVDVRTRKAQGRGTAWAFGSFGGGEERRLGSDRRRQKRRPLPNQPSRRQMCSHSLRPRLAAAARQRRLFIERVERVALLRLNLCGEADDRSLYVADSAGGGVECVGRPRPVTPSSECNQRSVSFALDQRDGQRNPIPLKVGQLDMGMLDIVVEGGKCPDIARRSTSSAIREHGARVSRGLDCFRRRRALLASGRLNRARAFRLRVLRPVWVSRSSITAVCAAASARPCVSHDLAVECTAGRTASFW